MSKKKKIGIILILMIIVGYFAYGTLTTAEQEKEKKFISEPLTEDKFELVKFSTVDYPTLTATLYLATDKKNPVFRLYDEIVDGTTVTDIAYKVTEPLKVDTGNGGVDGQSFTVEIYNANGLIIKATDIDYLSGITKGNTDLEYYRIEITYTTDQTKNTDSAKFEIRNEKDDENSKVSSSIMNYFTYKIQAEFTNPTVSNPKIIKEESGITLTAKASATKMRGEYTVSTTGASISDSNTTITTGTTYDTNYEAKDNTEDDPIIKGEFYITGDKSDDGITTIESGVSTPTYTVNPSSGDTLPLLNTDSNKNKWYEASTIISVEEFNEKLGKKPKNAKIYFTATAKSGKTKIIELPISDIVEKVRPKITNITLTNTTLAAFMKALKTTNGTAISDTFNSTEITNKTVSKQDDASSSGITDLTSKLNVKNGDNVDVEFTVDDESIFLNTEKGVTTQYGTVQVKYGNQAYSAVYQSTNGTQTTWKAKIIYNSSLTSQDLSFNIRDSSSIINSYGTTGNVRIVSGTPFVVPDLLGTTKMAPNTGNPAGSEYENYYSNNGVLNVETKPTEALAYIVMFDYDKTMSDKDSSYSYLYPTSDSVNWIGSSSGTFNLGDGHYKYAKVYIANNAGAISEIAYDGTLNDALSTIKVKSRTPDFYVDTVKPRVIDYNFDKISDANSELNSLDSTLNTILFGTGKPYKTNDYVEIKATVKEYNMAETTDTSGIVTWNVIPTAGTYDIINGASYEKKGTAVDLTVDTGNVPKIMSSTFYDKAGNSTIPTSVDITFDDRIPSTLTAINEPGLIIPSGVVIKFTKNISIPLGKVDDISKNPTLSVAVVNDSSVANATSDVNLTSFSPNVEINKNHNNVFNITTYSSSGEKGIRTQDSIVLDTEVNGGASFVNENYTTSGSYNVFNLNSLLDNVTELVGLKSFTVTKSGVGSNAKISDNGTEKSLGTEIYLADYSAYKEILTPTIYSALSTPRNYKLLIPKGISGKMTYNIMLKDRLNNYKNINYTVIITGKTNIIGTSKNSNMKITTTISNGSEMKIQARTE